MFLTALGSSLVVVEVYKCRYSFDLISYILGYSAALTSCVRLNTCLVIRGRTEL